MVDSKLGRRGRRRGLVFVPGPGGKTSGALNLLESHSCSGMGDVGAQCGAIALGEILAPGL